MTRNVAPGDDTDDPYHAMLRQAVHDAVHSVLRGGADPAVEAVGLSGVIHWVAAVHGPDALSDLSFHLALDLAECLAALAVHGGTTPLDFVDRWFHDVAQPVIDEDC